MSRLRYHNSRASRSIWFTGRSIGLSLFRSLDRSFCPGPKSHYLPLCVAQCDGDSTNGHSRLCSGVKHINDNDDDDDDEDGDADADGDDDHHDDDDGQTTTTKADAARLKMRRLSKPKE